MQKRQNRTFVCVMIIFTLFLTSCKSSHVGTQLKLDVDSEFPLVSSVATEETSERTDDTRKDEEAGEAENVEPVQDQIFVHICGAVRSPGVYEMNSESRIFEVIQEAGGLTEEADEAAINQAGRLEDGQQIYVYTKEEMKQMGNSAAIAEDGNLENADSGKVNLNTANKNQLMNLTGIGEAKAKAIIDYRENHGGFQSIEEIMQIDGIKEGVFQKIKDDITV